MVIEAKDSFRTTIKKDPIKAVTLRRTWSKVMVPDEGYPLPRIKLGDGRVAIVNSMKDLDIVRVDDFDPYYKRYFTEAFFTNEEINYPASPLHGKIRRV